MADFFKRRTVRVAGALILFIGILVGVRYWLYSRSHESTDDAFIDGHIVQVSPKASGYVAKIYVADNQQVKAGDLIVELDARDYEVRLQQAKAALNAGLAKQNEAKTNVLLTRATSSATIQQARAAVRKSHSEVESSRAGAAGLESRANQASSAIATAQANLHKLKHRLSQRKPKRRARMPMSLVTRRSFPKTRFQNNSWTRPLPQQRQPLLNWTPHVREASQQKPALTRLAPHRVQRRKQRSRPRRKSAAQKPVLMKHSVVLRKRIQPRNKWQLARLRLRRRAPPPNSFEPRLHKLSLNSRTRRSMRLSTGG